MHQTRLTGHNVIQLIYPIRTNQKNQSIIKTITEYPEVWKEIQFRSEEDMKHEDHIHSIFPKSYHTPVEREEGNNRNWIDNKTFLAYFHPSVRQALFNSTDKKLCIFRRNGGNQLFTGTFFNGMKEDFSLPSVSFEWISSEIYVFSKNSAFLVVRVSLLEHMQNKEPHQNSIVPLEVWMKFNNRIRQNYEKYSSQGRMYVKRNEEEQVNTYFFDFVRQMMQEDFQKQLALSSIQLNETNENSDMLERYKECLEPNAFIHSFGQSDLTSVPLETKELYQLTLVDDSEGESGGNKEFQESFLEPRVYKRWAPYTFYTAVDYGAMTIAHSTQAHYAGLQGESAFADILYQHHCRQYLILILLQLYYRDELMEIMGNYSNLEDLTSKNGSEKSRSLLTSYYNLNQHFFFDRLTHEIQGIELWHFYQKVLDTKRLYKAVQEDMRELNSRLIETESEKQNDNITLLTIVSAITGMLGMNIIFDDLTDVDAYTAFRNILPDSIAHFLHVAVSIIEHAFNFFVALIVVGIFTIVIKNRKALYRAFRIRKKKRKGQHS